MHSSGRHALYECTSYIIIPILVFSVLILLLKSPISSEKNHITLIFLNRINVILIDKTILNIGTYLYWCWWNYRFASVSTNEKTKTENQMVFRWHIFTYRFFSRFWTSKDYLIKPSGPLQLGVFLIKLFSTCVQKPPCGNSWVVVLRPPSWKYLRGNPLGSQFSTLGTKFEQLE